MQNQVACESIEPVDDYGLRAAISDRLQRLHQTDSAVKTVGATDTLVTRPGDDSMVMLLRPGANRVLLYVKAETFFGLAGIGDLATTCYSRHSRNRHVGEQIGRGKSLEAVLKDMQMVAEGIWTTRALFGPESEARGIPMPIAEQVHAVLFEKKDPRQAVTELMRRELSGEMDSLGDVLG